MGGSVFESDTGLVGRCWMVQPGGAVSTMPFAGELAAEEGRRGNRLKIEPGLVGPRDPEGGLVRGGASLK